MAIGEVAPQPVLEGFQARRQYPGVWEAIPIKNSSWHDFWHEHSNDQSGRQKAFLTAHARGTLSTLGTNFDQCIKPALRWL